MRTSRKRSLTSISPTPSGIRASPTPAIPCHPTMRSPRSILSSKNGLACRPGGKPGLTPSPTPRSQDRFRFKSRFVGNAGLPAWQIIMHVVNHATLHRGQIVGMLSQLGTKPPATDILFYYYEQDAPVAS